MMIRQPYQISVALRYLRARSRNGFISFISAVSMIGIGLGVAVLIVVLSVMNGFEHELQQRILGIVSDATITGLEAPLDDWRDTRERALLQEDIVAAAPFIEGQGLSVAGEAVAGVAIRGIEPTLEGQVTGIAGMMVAGRLEALVAGEFGIVIGGRLADQLGVATGDRVVLALAEAIVTPAGMMPRTRSFTVVGIFDAGMYEYDRGLVFVHLEDAARLFRTDGRAHGLKLAVTDIYFAGRSVRDLALALGGGYYISDWTRQHVNFLRSIQLTKGIMFVVLSLVIGVAAFNIVSTLVMVVREKRGDIAILRSMGAPPSSIMAVFATQGTLIGVFGTAFGLALGLLVTSQLENIVALLEAWMNTDLVTGEVYWLSDLPTQVRVVEVLQICVLAAALAVAATFYPALAAARQAPAEALRHD